MMTTVQFVAGLIFLIVGAEVLVRGASRLAKGMGISSLIVGLTVVALGTSSPELAISIKSVLSDQGNIAVGNVIGSNIFNVLLILGLSALIVPLTVSRQLVRLDVPLMIAISVVVYLFSLDLLFSRTEGLILIGGLVIYIVFLFSRNRKESTIEASESPAFEKSAEIMPQGPQDKVQPGKTPEKTSHWAVNLVMAVAGLGLLVLGSRWMVNSAVTFAQYLGISELVIGLTIIAAGTSLPEVVTSVIAAFRGERDIAVGNIVGSNIFNLMCVLGIASVVAPDGIEVTMSVVRFDLPIMIVIAFVCLPIFFTGGVISRWEGIVLLAYYVAYSLFLFLASTQHDMLSNYSSAIIYFAIPLTFITVIVITVQQFQTRHRGNG